MEGKRGAMDLLNNVVIFIVLNVIFFSIMLYFVIRAASGAESLEQVYAKEIALLLDQAKPETSFSLDVSPLFLKADKNNFPRLKTIKIDNENKEVIVKVDQGRGYKYNFFSDDIILWSLKKKSMILEVEIKEKKKNKNEG